MNFEEALLKFDTIVTNAPLGTRLKYDYGFDISFRAIESEAGQQALIALCEGDILVAQEYQLPIIIHSPTFRASRNHLLTAGFTEFRDIQRINRNAINIINALRDDYSKPNSPVFSAASLGSMHDAYGTADIPTIKEAQAYHAEQINIFKESNVDFVNAVTLPSLAEAIGISLAADVANVNYTIGFIINENATLLDGTNLHEAMDTIDSKTTRKPQGYFITCTHASVIEKLAQTPGEYERFIGVQPNGSCLAPDQLVSMDKAMADSPEKFTNDLMHLKRLFNLKILGGCCGTTREHLKSLCQACACNNQ